MSDLQRNPHVFSGLLQQPKGAMTARERGDLCQIVRQQVRAAKAAVEQRSAQLRADFENQLLSEYSYDQDEVWRQAAEEAMRVARDAQARVAQRCRELGIPDRFAPSLSASWYGVGEQGCRKRRADLRRQADKEIEAREKAALAQIEQVSASIQTEIMATGITSEEGRAFLQRLPSVETLMPAIEVGRVEAMLEDQSRRH